MTFVKFVQYIFMCDRISLEPQVFDGISSALCELSLQDRSYQFNIKCLIILGVYSLLYITWVEVNLLFVFNFTHELYVSFTLKVFLYRLFTDYKASFIVI